VGVVALLLVPVFISYVDRGNLSMAAPVLAPELSLTPAHPGWLVSAFFRIYSTVPILAGWLVDRYSVASAASSGRRPCLRVV
jgi:MFS transporter, ACS family, D-galactonate transporter